MRGKGPQRDAEKERFWREAICRQRRSGQSVRGFCRNETLSEPSFYAWRRELKQRGGKQHDDKQPVGQAQRGGKQRDDKQRGDKQRDDKQPVGQAQRGDKQRGGRRQVRRSQRQSARRPAFVAVQLAVGAIPMTAGAIPMTAGAIELALPNGAVLRMPSSIEPATIAAIVNAWEQERC
jgi:hypothetical protein